MMPVNEAEQAREAINKMADPDYLKDMLSKVDENLADRDKAIEFMKELDAVIIQIAKDGPDAMKDEAGRGKRLKEVIDKYLVEPNDCFKMMGAYRSIYELAKQAQVLCMNQLLTILSRQTGDEADIAK